MTEAQKEYESVDWHGENLHIEQDGRGYVTISRPPFETDFYPCEMKEISQFIHEYVDSSAKSEAVLEELRKHFVKLYDDGFKDPLVTFDAAISMMKYGDTKLRQQER